MGHYCKWIAAISLFAVHGLAWAQSWPSKPVRIIVPLSPEQFDKLIREELAANAALVKAAGIEGN